MQEVSLTLQKEKAAYQNAQKTLWEESGTMIPYHVSKLVGNFFKS
jgi:peptide/nickel transport system substrate-binding protein